MAATNGRQTFSELIAGFAAVPVTGVEIASDGTQVKHIKPSPAQWARRGFPRPSWVGVAVLAAILVGSVLRFVNLEGIPPAFNQDEAVYAYDAYSLFRTGRDHHGHPFPLAGSETFGPFSGSFLSFLAAPAVGIFGLRVAVFRGVCAAVGVLLIPIVYQLGVEFFGRRSIGVLAAWLVAVSPWHVHTSRFGNIPSIVPTMTALTLLLFVWSMRKCSDRGIVATALVASLAIASYHTMKVYLPMLGLAALLLYGRTMLQLKREALAYAAIILLVIAGPVQYLTAFDSGGRARADQVSVFNQPDAGPAMLVQQYLAYFSPGFLFVHGDRNPFHTAPGTGLELLSVLPFLLIGLTWLVWAAIRPGVSAHRRPALLLLAAVALAPFPGFLTVPAPNTQRVAHLMPLLPLIAAVGGVAAMGWIERQLGRTLLATRGSRLLLMLLVLLPLSVVGLETGRNLRRYFTDYPTQAASQYSYGMKEALAFARQHEAEYDEIWVADSNQPYIFVLFYNAWPPEDVHRNLQVRRNPPGWNEVEAIGKYRFPREIYGSAPADIHQENLPLLYSVPYPDHSIAYEVRGGIVPGRGRVLLIDRP